jgi:hypothetical protein
MTLFSTRATTLGGAMLGGRCQLLALAGLMVTESRPGPSAPGESRARHDVIGEFVIGGGDDADNAIQRR